MNIMNKHKTKWFQLSIDKVATGLLVTSIGMLSNIGIAHAELSISEKDPESSIVNQYEQYKTSDLDALSVSSFVDQLNQRVEQNPKDSLAWEILAKVYYDYGDIDYAVYAASEAIDSGSMDNDLYTILLTGSSFIAADQLEAGYADQIDSEKFINQYQAAISKVYGTMHGFNYNETLPKPVVRKTPSRAVKKYTPKKRVTRNKRAAVKSKPKPKVASKKRNRPVSKPKPQAPRSTTPSVDPFKILR